MALIEAKNGRIELVLSDGSTIHVGTVTEFELTRIDDMPALRYIPKIAQLSIRLMWRSVRTRQQAPLVERIDRPRVRALLTLPARDPKRAN